VSFAPKVATPKFEHYVIFSFLSVLDSFFRPSRPITQKRAVKKQHLLTRKESTVDLLQVTSAADTSKGFGCWQEQIVARLQSAVVFLHFNRGVTENNLHEYSTISFVDWE
jgi:hypothetical protein